MRVLSVHACLMFFLTGCSVLSPGTGFVHAQGKELATPEGKPLILRGVNLANWLGPEGYMLGFKYGPQSPSQVEALTADLIGKEESMRFWQAYRDAYITEADMKFIHDAGLNSVRIPVYSERFSNGEGDFTELDRVITWASRYRIYVILDMHAAPGGQTGTNIDDSRWGYPWLFESAKAQDLTTDIWVRIAGHYRNNRTVLGYDLLNEPIPPKPELMRYNVLLEPLYKRIATAIRKVDSHHVIILEGAQWATNLTVFSPPFDSNVMYSFHMYWAPPTEATLKPYLDFREVYDVPVWLGESGENNDAWIHRFKALLEKENIGWAFWPYKKMDSTSGLVNWQKPVYWDEMVAYAADTHPKPSAEHSRAALQQLLSNVLFEHCRINKGYLEALH